MFIVFCILLFHIITGSLENMITALYFSYHNIFYPFTYVWGIWVISIILRFSDCSTIINDTEMNRVLQKHI